MDLGLFDWAPPIALAPVAAQGLMTEKRGWEGWQEGYIHESNHATAGLQREPLCLQVLIWEVGRRVRSFLQVTGPPTPACPPPHTA